MTRDSGWSLRRLVAGLAVAALAFAGPSSWAHHPGSALDDGVGQEAPLHTYDPSAPLATHDAAVAGMVVSPGPSADVVKNLTVAGRGVRLLAGATTDVWAHKGYAYIGTFNSPCGDGTGANGSGVRIFDVHNRNKVTPAGFLPSVAGSRINDIKVADLNSGTILVHSNESCATGGPGGFEVYDVADPRSPRHLASARVDDANAVIRDLFGGTDMGVHNLFLFRQGTRDYVAMQTHAFFGSFQIWELTDPTAPAFVSAWGAEFLCPAAPPTCSPDPHNETDVTTIVNHVNGWMLSGFGASQNRLLHDVTVTADGRLAYLSHWDAGLVLLDISDPAHPALISVALDRVNGSPGDGEVNSHAAWPTADGRVVVETEEDFSVRELEIPLDNFTFGDRPTNTIFGVGVSTSAGNDFEGSQTGNVVEVRATTVTVRSGALAGNVYAANEGSGNQPKLDGGSVVGEAVWIGRACNGDPILNAGAFQPGDIAVVRRGFCPFGDKLANAAALGAAGIVVANNVAVETPWSGIRIWDYSDPTSPVLASTFDTVCSLSPRDPSCDPRGTYSVHNVVVEGNKAYLSWYSDGVLILDISDPYNPVEVARYHRTGAAFEAKNGGIQNFWGIYKVPGEPWMYASDRNGGLYVLKEYGSGSAKRGKP